MIKCDGVMVVKAHRVVLASFSSTFEELLLKVDGKSMVNLDIDSKITGLAIKRSPKEYPILRLAPSFI